MSKAPSDIASAWVNEFQSGINAGDISQITKLFGVKGWWKDHFNISFDFNALKVCRFNLRVTFDPKNSS
jgi:hypothetical protein